MCLSSQTSYFPSVLNSYLLITCVLCKRHKIIWTFFSPRNDSENIFIQDLQYARYCAYSGRSLKICLYDRWVCDKDIRYFLKMECSVELRGHNIPTADCPWVAGRALWRRWYLHLEVGRFWYRRRAARGWEAFHFAVGWVNAFDCSRFSVRDWRGNRGVSQGQIITQLTLFIGNVWIFPARLSPERCVRCLYC